MLSCANDGVICIWGIGGGITDSVVVSDRYTDVVCEYRSCKWIKRYFVVFIRVRCALFYERVVIIRARERFYFEENTRERNNFIVFLRDYTEFIFSIFNINEYLLMTIY